MANLERGKQIIRGNGAEFHYVAKGQGTPVVLVHGGLVDFRRWAAQIDPFSERHHVVAYSRRFNYPNKDHGPVANYSAIVDADDLAEVIRQLESLEIS